jgi:septum formation protein
LSFEKIFKHKYILASKSPRRIKLLKQLGLDFLPRASKIEELESNIFKPVEIIRTNSKSKAENVAKLFNDRIIIAADTIVAIDKCVYHKPIDEKEAKKFLKILSGKKHIVYTGIYVINLINNNRLFDFEKTNVYFRNLSDNEINYYVKYNNPLDKAGSYGIQDDFGCLLVKKIEGDYYNVVGLPLVKLYEMLLKII